jgi:hypothetical protein
MFVRGIVVCNQMQIEVGWRFAINLFEKAQLFDVRVARLGASNQLARQLDKGCKQRDCAVPHIVARHPARLLAMHEVPRTLQRHKLKVRAEEFLLPLEHLRPMQPSSALRIMRVGRLICVYSSAQLSRSVKARGMAR